MCDFKNFLVERKNPFAPGFRRVVKVELKDGSFATLTFKAGFTGYGASNTEASTIDVEIEVNDQYAGSASFKRASGGRKIVSADVISLRPAYQRKGVATAIYDELEKIGLAIEPSALQTDAGKKFWRARTK